mgnify:CR=1 FL=1
MFTSRGYDIDVDNTAIGGTTAKYWARNPNSLLNRVNDNPDCQWVWLVRLERNRSSPRLARMDANANPPLRPAPPA